MNNLYYYLILKHLLTYYKNKPLFLIYFVENIYFHILSNKMNLLNLTLNRFQFPLALFCRDYYLLIRLHSQIDNQHHKEKFELVYYNNVLKEYYYLRSNN